LEGKNMFEIRQATESDVENITDLFYETIQNINSKDYLQEEIDDWSSWRSDFEKWKKGISEQYFIVAVKQGNVVGFSSIAKDGYLDFMFTHKDFQRQGIAKSMLMELERKALMQNNDYIYSDVSITAKDFFLSQGYEIERQQLKKSKERELINFRMIKRMKN
jgi:putative acetyltransferase